MNSSGSSGNSPSLDPANNGSLAGVLRFFFGKAMQSVDNVLPAKVIAYDREANRVQVQILIATITTGGERVSGAQVASIPVLVLGGGGFMLNFPLTEGDLGWIVATDRDISLFLESYAESAPNTNRVKDFSSAVFVPDIMTNYTINEEDSGSAVLSSTDGTVRIALSSDSVAITAPEVAVNSPAVTITSDLTTVDGNLLVTGNIEAQGGLTGESGSPLAVTGDVDLTGNLAVDGNITATGTITPEA